MARSRETKVLQGRCRMGVRARQRVMFGVLVLAAVLVPVGVSQAGSCAAGASCNVEMTNTNVTGVTVDIRVTINNTVAGQTTLTVAFISDNISNTPLGIDQFGYNSAVAAKTLPAGFSQAVNCPCNQDGFGKFASEIDSPGGTLLTFSVVLASQVTSFADNANGAEFAAHIRYSGGC